MQQMLDSQEHETALKVLAPDTYDGSSGFLLLKLLFNLHESTSGKLPTLLSGIVRYLNFTSNP